MKFFKYLIYFTVISVLIISFTPMKLYYQKISKNLKPIQLEGISGSIIKGSAQSLKYLGLDIGQVNWLMYPSSYNRMTLNLNIRDELYDFKGDFIKSSDTESLNNVLGTLDWSIIKKTINFNRGEMSGYVKFDFEHIEFKNRIPEKIIGKAVTKDLKILKPINKEIGEIEVVFVSDNPSIIVGQVNSKSNVINISGAIYIHKNHRWEVKLTLIPMPGEYEIEYAIQNIGDPRRGGGRSLNMAGFY